MRGPWCFAAQSCEIQSSQSQVCDRHDLTRLWPAGAAVGAAGQEPYSAYLGRQNVLFSKFGWGRLAPEQSEHYAADGGGVRGGAFV